MMIPVRMLSGALLAALIVAGAALALAGPRTPPVGPPAGAHGPRHPAQVVAGEILAAFAPPAGAVALRSDPTGGLAGPSDDLPAPRGVDLHRFFLVAGDPQGLIDSISYQHALPVILGEVGTTRADLVSASEIYDVGPIGGMAGRLELKATRLAGGVCALRVDAQAWRSGSRRARVGAS